jgi:transposase
MSAVTSRRKYDREFKLEAVRLVMQGGRPVAEVARDLGIHENLLYNWRRKYLDDTVHVFPGKGHLKPADEEMRRLKKELSSPLQEQGTSRTGSEKDQGTISSVRIRVTPRENANYLLPGCQPKR